MTYLFKLKISKTVILTIGLILGLLVIVKGQSVHDIKQFSGVYVTENQSLGYKMELTLNEKFSIIDEYGSEIKISVDRLVDKISVIDVITYFYEVSLKKENQELMIKKTMELIHNSTTDLVSIEIADLQTLKRVNSI